MKKVIFMGKTGSGKTTLCQKIHDLDLKYKKTQSVEIYDESIDTPGEYLENRSYYKALIVTAVDADVIALVCDCISEEAYIAPGFCSMFAKECIGIITKIDIAPNNDKIKQAREILQEAGVSRIFEVNTLDGTGIQELIKYLSS